MSKHPRRSIEHRFRCKVWFAFFLVCAVVLFFPPWIISDEESRPATFSPHWFTDSEFHFLAYQPPFGHMNAHFYGRNGCEKIAIPYSSYKHLNYYVLGFEVIGLGVLAGILRLVIRRHSDSS